MAPTGWIPSGYTTATDSATCTSTATVICYYNDTSTTGGYVITGGWNYGYNITSAYVPPIKKTPEQIAAAEAEQHRLDVERWAREDRERLMKRLGVAGYRSIDIDESLIVERNRDPAAVKLLYERIKSFCKERRLEID